MQVLQSASSFEVKVPLFSNTLCYSDDTSPLGDGNHSGMSNNLSNESLEMPPLPMMDSDDGEPY